ncbi:hypothetical protein ACFLTY_05110 [Chloroflexota bacterium]
MAESSKEDIILMAVFTVTKDDVLTCADELGIPREKVTSDAIEILKEKVSQGLDDLREAVKDMIEEAIKCPLELDCYPSCAWWESGKCVFPKRLIRS